jgi:hypothetical protein
MSSVTAIASYIIVTCWVYVTRQVTSRRIGSSEFIPLAHTFTSFTILQLLPSAVSQLLILLVTSIRLIQQWTSTHSGECYLLTNCLGIPVSYKPSAGHTENVSPSVLLYALPSNHCLAMSCLLLA